jgi:alpha-L-rhamnosidase
MPKTIAALILTTAVAAVPPAAPAGEASIRPADLRCEYRKEPLGIDEPRPRLSWVLEAGSPGARGLRQTAYQVLVASSPDALRADRGDLWDSGKVESDRSVHVEYAGKALNSGQPVAWKVRAWDGAGVPSAWSEPARWSMGLPPGDWRGTWIGMDRSAEGTGASRLAGAKWIWLAEGNPAASAPVATRWFRKTFEIPGRRTVRRATLLVTADNDFAASVNGKKAAGGASFAQLFEADVAALLVPGRNALAVAARNLGDAPNPAGLIGLLRIEFAEGDPLVVATDASWRASAAEAAGWDGPGFDDAGWSPAKELGPDGTKPWPTVGTQETRRLPARHLRKEFEATGDIVRATAYVSGQGLYELEVNGKKAGDHVLSPALSEYPKRVYYVTHDVTPLIRSGKNALGVILGNGRFFAPRLKVPTETRTYGDPMLLLELRLEGADGTVRSVSSDLTWMVTDRGPIVANNEYDGEEYDARLELPGWSAPGFDDGAWKPAKAMEGPKGGLVAQMVDPIRVIETLRPVAVKSPAPGTFIFDMGQNMVGWCRLAVQGPRGTAVSLRHAETLKPDGTLYLDNIRGAKVTDIYTLKGGGPETWEPRFTYHGFRFVEVRGYPGEPPLGAIEGRVVHDDLEPAGTFSCSEPILERIYRNIRWGVRGNYRSIPTDCPQRDERQGWLGDRSAESRGESYLFRVAPLYAKWMADIEDAQKESGSVPDVAPSYWPIYSDNVTWPSSFVIVPGSMRLQYGEERIIARRYEGMKRWIDFMTRFVKDGIQPRDTYGDWCVPPEDPKLIHSNDPARKTPGDVIGTAYFHHDLKLMAGYARLLGKAADAEKYAALADTLKAGFNRKFLAATGDRYANGSQTSSVLPLALGIVPPENRKPVFGRLVDKIVGEGKGHIGTGLIGGQWLMGVLTEGGRPDVALGMATKTAYPSWGYMAERGATTIWELWNGDTADPAMNSGNHVMLVGDLLAWLHESVAGIAPDPEAPGFRRIIVRPRLTKQMKSAAALHRSLYGPIEVSWERGDRLRLRLSVPPNTAAVVHVPAASAADVTEGGKPASGANGVRLLREEGGAAAFEVGSGKYEFEAR